MFKMTLEEHEAIWKTYFKEEGHQLRLIQMPSKLLKKYSILVKIWMSFPKKFEGTEQDVNLVIQPIFEDYVTIRRYLVDYHFLIRDAYGKKYALNEDLNVLK